MRKPYIKPRADGGFLVGANDLSDKEWPYYGPCAAVYMGDGWVYVETDSYEGCAMLNIEALPNLIRALRKLQKELVAQPVTKE